MYRSKKNIKPYISHVIGTVICITLHIDLTKLKYKVCQATNVQLIIKWSVLGQIKMCMGYH